jgi:acyl carrier protein
MSDQPETLSRVKAAIVESLSMEPEEVEPRQRFFTDLGGESMEWLDLSFRLDKEFGVRIPGIGSFASAETDAEGRLTTEGIATLRTFLPSSLVDRVQDQRPHPTPKELADEITVEDIAGIVRMAVNAKGALPTS